MQFYFIDHMLRHFLYDFEQHMNQLVSSLTAIEQMSKSISVHLTPKGLVIRPSFV